MPLFGDWGGMALPDLYQPAQIPLGGAFTLGQLGIPGSGTTPPFLGSSTGTFLGNLLNPNQGKLIPLISGATSVLGDIISNLPGARTQTSQPFLTPEYKTLGDLMRTRAEQRLRSNFDLSGLAANQIAGVNQAFAGANQAVQNNLTARGLATSPVAATVDTNLQLGRAGNIANVLNQLPFIQRQMEAQDLQQAQQIASTFGRGTSQVGAGSAFGAGLNSAAEQLMLLRGMGVI